jgi:hypothetical protein
VVLVSFVQEEMKQKICRYIFNRHLVAPTLFLLYLLKKMAMITLLDPAGCPYPSGTPTAGSSRKGLLRWKSEFFMMEDFLNLGLRFEK